MKRQTSRTRPHHLIQRLRVIGGFLDGLDIQFADGLNCIIGPRGVGKTTILEMMRFALDTMPGREGDPLRTAGGACHRNQRATWGGSKVEGHAAERRPQCRGDQQRSRS